MEAATAIQGFTAVINGIGQAYAASQGKQADAAQPGPALSNARDSDAKSAGSGSSQEAMEKLRKLFQDSGGSVPEAEFERFIGKDPELNQAYASLKAKGAFTSDSSGPGGSFIVNPSVNFTQHPKGDIVASDGHPDVRVAPTDDQINDAYEKNFTAGE